MLKVLVPIDFSENSRKALNVANSLVDQVGGVIELVTVFLPLGGSYGILQGLSMKKSENIKLALEGQLTALAAEVCSVDTNVTVIEGDIVEGVLYLAKTKSVDIIMMGTKGKSNLSNVFMGSNAMSVVQKSLVPVIAVPYNSQVQNITKILYASDFENFKSEYSFIKSFAEKANWPIKVVHVLRQKETETAARQSFNTVSDTSSELILIESAGEESLSQALKNFLNTQKDAVLVMFTEKRSFIERLFSTSQTSNMSYTETLPLMSIRKDRVIKE